MHRVDHQRQGAEQAQPPERLRDDAATLALRRRPLHQDPQGEECLSEPTDGIPHLEAQDERPAREHAQEVGGGHGGVLAFSLDPSMRISVGARSLVL